MSSDTEAEFAATLFAENEEKILTMCRNVGIDTSYCGDNAVSAVSVLCELVTALRSMIAGQGDAENREALKKEFLQYITPDEF